MFRNCSGRVRSRRAPTPRVALASLLQNHSVRTKGAKYPGRDSVGTHRKVRYSGDTNQPANSGGTNSNSSLPALNLTQKHRPVVKAIECAVGRCRSLDGTLRE